MQPLFLFPPYLCYDTDANIKYCVNSGRKKLFIDWLFVGTKLLLLAAKRSYEFFLTSFTYFPLLLLEILQFGTERIEPSPWISSSSSPYFHKYSNSWSPPSSGIEYQQTKQAKGRPKTQIKDNWCTASFSLNVNPISCKMVTRIHTLSASVRRTVIWMEIW